MSTPEPSSSNMPTSVPGSIRLLPSPKNRPPSRQNMTPRMSRSSVTAHFPGVILAKNKKTTSDGTIILEPQPDDSNNDPLNWPAWRRNLALVALGFYSMVGGGLPPIVAAGFTDISQEFEVGIESVSLVAGLCMMGLGIGAMLVSPLAILYGKRPVYLVSASILIATSLWASWAPSLGSLLAARVFQGISASPIECLPCGTVAEMFFLHERAYRIGIYTLLLLSGQNLSPIISAAIIQRTIAAIVGLNFMLLFFLVPETFWDRTATRRSSIAASLVRRLSSYPTRWWPYKSSNNREDASSEDDASTSRASQRSVLRKPAKTDQDYDLAEDCSGHVEVELWPVPGNAITYPAEVKRLSTIDSSGRKPSVQVSKRSVVGFAQRLKPYHGRLSQESFLRVMLRPFVLFAYPNVLWAAVIYSCSVGWLVVISETLAMIFRNPSTYNFTALQTGLVYLSPFVGSLLGAGVASKISDLVVKFMARRNGGIYEPEFRLLMGSPILFTTCMGLMGFGWSAQLGNHWIVPTWFFGMVSFGCSLGMTTSLTFCVDSCREYVGEAMVTLNISKNIFHGFIFSLFVADWMAAEGPREMYVWLGVIHLVILLSTIPMYIYGKRSRMWMVRRNLMERL
ncbi:major facilitator superfamily domain-containing protein [Stachybotrys elegans]|uniref:Major facilitator superfamily domain-containing protein n=1 Tax=Stachybotrys elegans TaxID=80388 RepID=A0A8K0SFC2_9HYPO|nr:major facilitator superfamily domain-containing protein [Stachybotrys elegans]